MRGYFRKLGEKETAPIPFQQSIDDFIEELHSRSSFAREWMEEQKAVDLDSQIKKILQQYHPKGILPLQVVATVTWGKPENVNTNS